MKRPRADDNLLTIFGVAPKKKLPPPPLAVPLHIQVPAVARLDEAGGGLVTTLSGQVKKVTKGKNATKGRGAVASTNVPVVQPCQSPTKTPPHAQTSSPRQPPQAQQPPPQLEPDVDAHESFAVKRRREEAHIALERSVWRASPEPTHHRPRYVDDAWSIASVGAVRREMSFKRHKGARPCTTARVPAFYHRRERDPIATIVKSKTDDSETHCKLLTFHADGSFEWPSTSPHVCWNCCYNFDGPPAMIPRFYNRYHNVYEVYGNFCTWSCAKRYAQNTKSEYYHDHAPSLDVFADTYFGVPGPIPVAPPHLLLEKFSAFGMSIDEYRAQGTGEYAHVVGHKLVQPPCVPYEMFVMWQNRTPANKKIHTGYAQDKKNLFERQMQGNAPLPQMPPAIDPTQTPLPLSAKHKIATKKQKKNLLSLFT